MRSDDAAHSHQDEKLVHCGRAIIDRVADLAHHDDDHQNEHH